MDSVSPISDHSAVDLHQWCDIIVDVDANFDKELIGKFSVQGRYAEMPVPFCPKRSIPLPYTMQIVAVENDKNGPFRPTVKTVV